MVDPNLQLNNTTFHLFTLAPFPHFPRKIIWATLLLVILPIKRRHTPKDWSWAALLKSEKGLSRRAHQSAHLWVVFFFFHHTAAANDSAQRKCIKRLPSKFSESSCQKDWLSNLSRDLLHVKIIQYSESGRGAAGLSGIKCAMLSWRSFHRLP